MSYSLPQLPYSYDALEPYIDALTMEIHYTKHHQTYVTNLNKALDAYPDLQKKSLDTLLKEIAGVPEAIRTAVRNNGGGHYNHSFFWPLMTPKSQGEPVGLVAEKIKKKFGSFGEFKEQFSTAAKSVFGSGWAWLGVGVDGELVLFAMPNQDAPIMQGIQPVLGLDVWEHAYYLHYQNRRPDYISAWWNVVNWAQVEENYRELL